MERLASSYIWKSTCPGVWVETSKEIQGPLLKGYYTIRIRKILMLVSDFSGERKRGCL